MKRAPILVAALCLVGCGGVIASVRQEQASHQADVRACDGGNGHACVRVGEVDRRRHERAPAGRRDPLARARAMDRFDRACALGVAAGCMALSRLWNGGQEGSGIADPRSFAPAQRACDLGLAAGCLAAADHRDARDVAAARPQLVRACDLDAASCPAAARIAGRIDAALATTLAARPCDRVLPEACARSADLPLPPAARDRLHARACELGAAACVAGGRWFEARDRALAERLYRRGCKSGLSEACVGLGRVLTSASAD